MRDKVSSSQVRVGNYTLSTIKTAIATEMDCAVSQLTTTGEELGDAVDPHCHREGNVIWVDNASFMDRRRSLC